MNCSAFNEKYQEYLDEGHYGLAINDKRVIAYLDNLFQTTLTHIPGFKYQQIKLKFNQARFYTNLNLLKNTNVSENLELIVEEQINKILEIEDDVPRI